MYINALQRNGVAVAAVFVLSTVLPLLAAMPAHAAGEDVAALRQQVQVLTHRVEQLERKVAELEKVPPSKLPADNPNVRSESNAQAPTKSTAAAYRGVSKDTLRKAWRAVDRNLTATEVKNILGQPSRQFQLNGNTILYYHYANIGSGSVTVSPNGQVIDWQRPPLGWPW